MSHLLQDTQLLTYSCSHVILMSGPDEPLANEDLRMLIVKDLTMEMQLIVRNMGEELKIPP